jgi:hypothetical protein
MSQYLAQGVSRETVYTALATKIATTLGLNSFVRGWPPLANLDVSQSPTGYLHQATSKPIQKWGHPPVYIDRALLWVLIAQQPIDPGITTSPSTQLNVLRDLLDTALKSDQGDQNVCTLGGLVHHCWAVEDTIFESIAGLAWTLFRTHIEIQYFSLNNM